MLSHIEYFKQMLDSINAEYYHFQYPGEYGGVQYAQEIRVENTKGQGYSEFFSTWAFNSEGKLVSIGHYE